MIKTDLNKIFVVIPAKDEANLIGGVLDKLASSSIKNVIVVDDGSKDTTPDIVKSYDITTLLTHKINLGPGASTLTGIKYAVKAGAEIVLTMDADDQHDVSDLIPLVKKLEDSSADLVIGSRFMKADNDIPFLRILYNKFGNIISYLLTGFYLSDSQSGMKAMNRKFADHLNIDFNGFEFCIEIIKNAQNYNAKIVEYPIAVKYTPETMKKGQNLGSGFSMLAKLFSPFSY